MGVVGVAAGATPGAARTLALALPHAFLLGLRAGASLELIFYLLIE